MTLPIGAGSTAPARVVFFGSGAFAVPILATLVRRADVLVVGVVTPPDRAAGRRGRPAAVPAAAAARAAGLPLLQFSRVRSPDALEAIRALDPDLGVLADFGQLIPEAIIELPPRGMLNVHPSLLPRHRGATPIPATILAGDATAGVSIMEMDAGLDTGPIVAARAWPLDGTEDAPELERRAAREGADLLDRVVTAVLTGRATSRPQDASGATMTHQLHRESGRLDPRRSAADLERQVRALRPWPGTYIEIGNVRLVVHDVAVRQAQPGDVPGVLFADDDGMALSTIDGRLGLEVVQPAGGRAMAGAAFRRGRPTIIGSMVTSRPAAVEPDEASS